MTKKQKNKKNKSKAFFVLNKSVIILIGIIVLSFGFLVYAGLRNDRARGNNPATPTSNPKAEQYDVLKDEKTSNKNQNSADQGTSGNQIASNEQIAKPQTVPENSILKDKQYPQMRYEALATANDPYYGGSYSGNWYHSTVQTGRSWDASIGNNSTVIAVIDTGFALEHEDLTNKWHTDSGEIGTTQSGDSCHALHPGDKKTNNCDDDNNGYIDDWRGWDFTANDNNPQTGSTNSTGNGVEHGTIVSGLIAATANNSAGNAGIDQQAKIMPLMGLDDNGSGYTNDIVLAVEYAVANGANIINMSLGGNGYDAALLQAVDDAKSAGVLVVVASGNCGTSTVDLCSGLDAPGRMTYPAKYTSTLSVGSTNSSDTRSSFSSYGSELDIVAPGDQVGPLAGWSLGNQTSEYYAYASGTSFASPIVAGIAGLVRSQLGNPSVDQLTNVLLDSTDKIAGLGGATRNNEYGYGRVNAHKATVLAKSIVNPPGTVGTTAIEARQPARGGITRTTSGSIQSDEWSVIACRVDASDACGTAITNGANVLRIDPVDRTKGASLYYMFVKGSSLASGTSTVSVHNRNYATGVGTLIK